MKRVKGKKEGQMFSRIILAVIAVFFTAGLAFADTMLVPTGQQYFEYAAVSQAIEDVDPNVALPIGIGSVADDGDTFSLNINLPQFSGEVDIYLGIGVPDLAPNDIFIVKSDSTLQSASAGLVAWRANTLGPINESLWGNIPEDALPDGEYDIFLLIVPSNALSGSTSSKNLTTGHGVTGADVLHTNMFSMYSLWKTIYSKQPSLYGEARDGVITADFHIGPVTSGPVTMTANVNYSFTFTVSRKNKISLKNNLLGKTDLYSEPMCLTGGYNKYKGTVNIDPGGVWGFALRDRVSGLKYLYFSIRERYDVQAEGMCPSTGLWSIPISWTERSEFLVTAVSGETVKQINWEWGQFGSGEKTWSLFFPGGDYQ